MFPHPTRCMHMLVLMLMGASIAATVCAQISPVPLVAHYAMDPDPTNPSRMADSGPLKLDGTFHSGVTVVDGRSGSARHFDGTGEGYAEARGGLLDRLSGSLTITMWVRLSRLPENPGGSGIIAKRAQNVSAVRSLHRAERLIGLRG